MPFILAALCLWVLSQRLGTLDLRDVIAAMKSVGPFQWTVAALATALSLWAVGRYDAVVHRHLGTGVSGRDATRAGVISIALSQTVGMGLLSGTLARWRMLPGIGIGTAARITAYVAVSFMAGLAVVLAITGLALPLPGGLPPALPALILAATLGLVILCFLRPSLRVWRYRITLPSLPAMAAILGLTALDTVAAAAALHVLLPPAIAPGFDLMLPVFMIALGAGLMTGAPGGIGAFELTLVALMPHLPQAELLGAVLAFRLIYYAIPACLAFVALARPQPLQRHVPPLIDVTSPRGAALLARAKRSELGVLRQNGGMVLDLPEGAAGLVRTPQTLTLLFDPMHCPAHPGRLFSQTVRLARRQGRVAAFYKLSARPAAAARSMGLKLLHVADEAVIDTAGFSLQGARHRQLRRKLRHAEKAGLAFQHVPHLAPRQAPDQSMKRSADNAVDPGADRGPDQTPHQCTETLPYAAMAEVDAAWQEAHGGARGMSMGRFDPAYLREQWVFLARQNGQIIGFVTFHKGSHEICLDLMRMRPGLPDGTMHALIVTAIEAARAAGIARVSLAALPAAGRPERPVQAALRHRAIKALGTGGLRQFKLSFAPRLEPLYLAAPGWASLALAGLDLARAIRWPSALDGAMPAGARPEAASQTRTGDMPGACSGALQGNISGRMCSAAHDNHEEYEIASAAQT